MPLQPTSPHKPRGLSPADLGLHEQRLNALLAVSLANVADLRAVGLDDSYAIDRWLLGEQADIMSREAVEIMETIDKLRPVDFTSVKVAR